MTKKFTQIPQDTFKNLQLNAGIMLSDFDPSSGAVEVSNIIGATTGGVSFEATPTFTDNGEDIDNCPKNMMELKTLDSWEAKMSGTYVTVTANLAKRLTGAADVSDNVITPRNELSVNDFESVWWVGDYSDINTGDNAGFIAIQLSNALSTGGFKISASDSSKGQFSFEFTGHYSMEKPDEVPFKIYVQSGKAAA
jgi:hypothetical protein